MEFLSGQPSVADAAQYPVDKFVFSRCAAGFFLLIGDLGLREVFGLALEIFPPFGKTLPNDVHDSQRKYDPREKNHLSGTILTPIASSSKPTNATPAAIPQSSAVPCPARNNVSSGAKTNNRMPISRRASAHSSCRFLATA